MVTVSHLVKDIVRGKPFLQEALRQRIISYGNLAEQVKQKIDEAMGKAVKHSAIVMALRRYTDEIQDKEEQLKHFSYKSEINVKTNICDFTVLKSPSLLAKVKSLYGLVDFDKGDTLNIILGNNEVSIIINERYKEDLAKFLKGEKILNRQGNLVALTMRFTEDFMNTPGVIFNIVRRMAWENINIYEVISTLTEFTLILTNKDSMKAYESLQNLVTEGR